jgi:uncharacterized protein
MLLPDCTLFPHGGLPLFIFEPRYRRMLGDALEGDCIFAVTRLLLDERSGEEKPADIGTVGLVRASREQDDGTSQLLLHGVIRVRFTEWHDERDYPYASIEPVVSEFAPAHLEQAAMKTLRGAVEDAISGLPEEVRSGVMGLIDRADSAELMTDIISQQFVHEADLRQNLLECIPVGDRIPVLCEYLRKASDGKGG